MPELPPTIYQSFVATRVVNRIRSGDTDNVESAIDEAIKSNPAYAKFNWAGVKSKIIGDIEERITGAKVSKTTTKAVPKAKAVAAETSSAPEEYGSMEELMADPNLTVPKQVIAKGRKNLFAAPKVASVEESEGKLWIVEGAKKGGPDCAPGSKAFYAIVDDQDVLGCRKTNQQKK